VNLWIVLALASPALASPALANIRPPHPALASLRLVRYAKASGLLGKIFLKNIGPLKKPCKHFVYKALVELRGVEPRSGEGIDCAFYMFIGHCLSGKSRFTNYQPLPYSA